MDIKLFTQILKDKNIDNYEKMKYKYKNDFMDFLENLKLLFYKELPIKDFYGNQLVFRQEGIDLNQNSVKLLLKSQNDKFGIKAAENEIISTSAIENIDFDRKSVRNILKGLAPLDEMENRILGQKKGLEFISDPSNNITEENIYKLYQMTIGDFLDENDKLLKGNFYRHDSVYIVSNKTEHTELDYHKVPEYVDKLINFINTDDKINDLIKAAIIHFYIAYIHPYFDGNGRMSRFLHIWFLIQKGYESTLFLPFSELIQKEKPDYYKAFTLIEKNQSISGVTDITPFLKYFTDKIYNNISFKSESDDILNTYHEIFKTGIITEKETMLWNFVISFYGTEEFSTKQLEKDFGNAAYATIRNFVLKFTDLELLTCTHYGNRVKYKIKYNL